MMNLTIPLNKKQKIAFKYLLDSETNEIFYGGGAGGGKSFLGCFWIVYMCLNYPGTRYLMGRAHLKILKESTLLTLFNEVLPKFNLKKDIHFTYNSMEGRVRFFNGSEIFLKDLFVYPGDPEFDSLGSTEYTSGFLDEVSEISNKARDIVKSRMRYKLDEFKIKSKMLYASNPAKNWCYNEFYLPHIQGKLETNKKFIPALVGDNPKVSKQYKEGLLKINERSKQRLLYGNWEYDDDPSSLFFYEDILYLFENSMIEQGKNYYISCDVARMGDDKTVILVWREMVVVGMVVMEKEEVPTVANKIIQLANLYNVPKNNIVIDEDGVGGGVQDLVKGVGFINNSRPYDPISISKMQLIKQNYANLKTQCYFKLAELIRNRQIAIRIKPSIETRQRIISDLEQIKEKGATKSGTEFIQKEGKLQILTKQEIKQTYGKSPDFADAMMMRMLFEVKPRYKPHIAI